MTSAGAGTLAWLRKRRVAVLKGGWSRERAISLKTGAAVEAAFSRLGVRVAAVDVKRDVLGKLAALKPDLCFIALHGAFGEDGRIQSALEILGIPYTGSGPAASAMAMDKVVSKRLFLQDGVPTPAWTTVSAGDFGRNAEASLAGARALLRKGAVFVKPHDQGSAIGVSRVGNAAALKGAVMACLRMSDVALVESFVPGRELTVGILGPDALPVIEIVPEHAFYDFHSKYARGGSRHIVPAPISAASARHVQDAARAAYAAVGCSAYGRVDVMLDRASRPWVLEVNTIPGMTATSLLPDAARAAGIDFDELVLKIIQYSLESRRSGGKKNGR